MGRKEEIAEMLVRNGLSPSKEHAMILAEKFESMDTSTQKAMYEEHSPIEETPNHSADYQEDIAITCSNVSFSNMQHSTNSVKEEQRQPIQDDTHGSMNEAQKRLHNTKVDISEFFNVNNMKK
ncbi:MAG: hypothetical protein ACMXYL_04575 [Candidatus Woesearchaeota archaeon]